MRWRKRKQVEHAPVLTRFGERKGLFILVDVKAAEEAALRKLPDADPSEPVYDGAERLIRAEIENPAHWLDPDKLPDSIDEDGRRYATFEIDQRGRMVDQAGWEPQ
jgi:hypothetical protein